MLGHKTLRDNRGGVVGQILSESAHEKKQTCVDVYKVGECCVCICRLIFDVCPLMLLNQKNSV